MKNLLVTLIGVLAVGATLPAFAGPDWQIIEHGRKVKLARMQREATTAQVPATASRTPAAPAETTDRVRAHEKMLRQCEEMMKQAQQGANDQ